MNNQNIDENSLKKFLIRSYSNFYDSLSFFQELISLI